MMPPPGMSARDRVLWAKESMLEGADDAVQSYIDSVDEFDADEAEELIKQRNRVARFLGLPERQMYD